MQIYRDTRKIRDRTLKMGEKKSGMRVYRDHRVTQIIGVSHYLGTDDF